MSKLSKNIIYNLLGQGLLLILGFVAVKYVFRRLGEDALGIIYFTATLSTVLSAVLEMGMGSTTVREVSAHADDEPVYIFDFLRTASLFYWGGYVLLALGIYWITPFLVTKWIHLKELNFPTATLVLRILGIATLVAFPRAFYVTILRGLQRMEFNNIIDVGTTGLQLLGTIVILSLRGGLLEVAYWLAACFALGILAYILVSARFLSFSALIPGFSPAVVKRNFGYASRMACTSLLAMIHMQADKAVVSKLLPMGVFGYYGLAYGVVSRGTLATGAISQAAFPWFSALFKAGDRSSLMSQYRKLQDLFCFATVPLFAAIPFAAVPLFTYLLNAEAARMLLLPITLLCVGFYMNGTLNVPYIFSLAVGRPDIGTRSNFYALFAVLPVTIVLVYFFGLAGAGFSWIFYHLFAYAYMARRTCTECLKIPAWTWYVHVLKIVALTGGTYGVAAFLVASSRAYNVQSLAIAYTTASLAFLFGAYLMMGGELRVALAGILQTLNVRRVGVS